MKESVLAHNIVEVWHRPGESNGTADGISRQFVGVEDPKGDGHEWMVNENWEATTGLMHDLFQITTLDEHEGLQARFKNEPMISAILEALQELKHGSDVHEKRKARHRAREYMIEGGKLWRIGDGRLPRVCERHKCVTEPEMVELARNLHAKGGHFHRDNMKLALMDTNAGT